MSSDHEKRLNSLLDTFQLLECGCRVSLLPCESHVSEAKNLDEKFYVTIEARSNKFDFPGNNHRVDLERTQRIQLDIDDELMEFNERTIAAMLQKISDDTPYSQAAFVLRALANALLGNDKNHRLLLQQKKRGRWHSPGDINQQRRQYLAWAIRLQRLRNQGWPTDAAVYRIAETTGKSVSNIYAGIAEYKNREADLAEFLKCLSKLRTETKR